MKTFEFRVIAGDEDVPLEDVIREGMLITEAVIGMNLMWLERHPEMDCALTCGMVKYDSATKDVIAQIQDIKTGPVLVEAGIGLCLEIVALDCAIRRFHGNQAWPIIFSKGNGVFHVVTEANGAQGAPVIYDPSAELERQGHITNGQVDGCEC